MDKSRYEEIQDIIYSGMKDEEVGVEIKAYVDELYEFVRFVANDYIELSHDKVRWQRDDYIKRAREIIRK